MSKRRLGPADLLLLLALGLALTGRFFPAMFILAAYAVLYHAATRNNRP